MTPMDGMAEAGAEGEVIDIRYGTLWAKQLR
jgi:hypothetical protein